MRLETTTSPKQPVDIWHKPATIQRNHFKFKSLSCWSFNVAVGCSHACRFCYVPDVSTIKQAKKLLEYGVQDPDAEWGDYLLLRQWIPHAFLASLKKAEETPLSELNPDGNRAVMLCTTTDPYQVVRCSNAADRKALQHHLDTMVRAALELILTHSTLNVRILTRSPLAMQDFDLMKRFGPRLLFGMSLPTLDNTLAKVYEPKAPSPSARLRCLQEAKRHGLNVYVAMAPTYPECSSDDIAATLIAIKALNPVTVFHENINIRAQNVARITAHAATLGVQLKSEVFATPQAWRRYALEQLFLVEECAAFYGLKDQLHLWPDASLGTIQAVAEAEAGAHRQHQRLWLQRWWNRISEWPKETVDTHPNLG